MRLSKRAVYLLPVALYWSLGAIRFADHPFWEFMVLAIAAGITLRFALEDTP